MTSVFYALRPSSQTIGEIHSSIRTYKKEGGDPDNKITWANCLDLHTTLIHFKQIGDKDAELVKGFADKVAVPEEFSAKVVDVKILGDSLVLIFDHTAAKKAHEELLKLHEKELSNVTVSRHSGFIAHVSIGSVKDPRGNHDVTLDSLRKTFVGSTIAFDRFDLMTGRADRTNGPAYTSILTKPFGDDGNQNKLSTTT
jgi:2'-5' RNA ligase